MITWRRLAAVFATIALVTGSAPTATRADAPQRIYALEVVGPPGSEAFGRYVQVLDNGNYVVIDPLWDGPAGENLGAVYLYDGNDNTLISTLAGASPEDRIGSVRKVADSNFVVVSRGWDSPDAADVGAVTWVNGATGLDGVVSAENSLVGVTELQVGDATVLTNGNYVVTFGSAGNGAAAFARGDRGLVGLITESDRLDANGTVTPLTNGNYTVSQPSWPGSSQRVGFVAFGDGEVGVSGPVTVANSLIGSVAGDRVGVDVVALESGDYVVVSNEWSGGGPLRAGAVTFGDGNTGVVGEVTTDNSLHGSTERDRVGEASRIQSGGSVTPLDGSRYVVHSPYWDYGSVIDAGAATLSAGPNGITGPVTTANSLHGTHDHDLVGESGSIRLRGGNFVVLSPRWNLDYKDSPPFNHVPDRANGAATWVDVAVGVSGPVTRENSRYSTYSGSADRTETPGPGSCGGEALSTGGYILCRQWLVRREHNGDVYYVFRHSTYAWIGESAPVGGPLENDETVTRRALGLSVTPDDLAVLRGYEFRASGEPAELRVVDSQGIPVGSVGAVLGSSGDATVLPNGHVVVISNTVEFGEPGAWVLTVVDPHDPPIGELNSDNSVIGVGRDVAVLDDGDFVTFGPSDRTSDDGVVVYGTGDQVLNGNVNSQNSVTIPGVVGSFGWRPDPTRTSSGAIVVPAGHNRLVLVYTELPPLLGIEQPATGSLSPATRVDVAAL